jgi:tetratricopeptide (TPR) repeat protein
MITSADVGQLAAMITGGRYAALEERSRELLVRDPASGIVWKAFGISLAEQGKDALQAMQTAARLLPDDAEAHVNLANVMLDLGRLEEAVAGYRRALAINANLAVAHGKLGNALQRLGRLDDAVASYHKALALRPDYADGHNNLGNALQNLGRPEDAVAHYRRALQINPGNAEAHNNLGSAYQGLGSLDDAVASYERAIRLKPRYAEAHNNLAVVLRILGRAAEAEASCHRALEVDPNLAATLALLADLRIDAGRFEEAATLFKRALAIDPELPDAWAGIPRLRKMTAEDAPWLAEAQRIAAQGLPARQEVRLRYAIGKCFDDTLDFARAFDNYRRANELEKLYRDRYDRQRQTQAVNRIVRRYDRHWVNQIRADAIESPRPVFIIGMPRSGTTLAEQILASHPAVFGAGELPFWTDASAIQDSTSDGAIGDAALSVLGRDYLTRLEGSSSDAPRVTDKMPGNVWSLGLIHAALPNTRFIHMQRNPIDTCLSIYFQHFETGHAYANDLEDLAHHYREYLRVMEHWRAILPSELILDVPYEALVDEQETWSRTMLEFIGLPWDTRCLDFHRTERAVITASRWQVRQTISRASVGRWRNYREFVEPLISL